MKEAGKLAHNEAFNNRMVWRTSIRLSNNAKTQDDLKQCGQILNFI
jgi:hypothetical protein